MTALILSAWVHLTATLLHGACPNFHLYAADGGGPWREVNARSAPSATAPLAALDVAHDGDTLGVWVSQSTSGTHGVAYSCRCGDGPISMVAARVTASHSDSIYALWHPGTGELHTRWYQGNGGTLSLDGFKPFMQDTALRVVTYATVRKRWWAHILEVCGYVK